MNNAVKREQVWKQHFPSLVNTNDEYISVLINKSRLITIAAKQKILMPGAQCKDYLLVAEGRLRIQFITKAGREVVLYHVNAGDDCVLTTSCLFGEEDFPAEGITESDVTVIAIPAMVFHQTIQHSVSFRKFVFSTFGKRLADVITRMEVLYSSSIEDQLAKALLFLGKENPVINITHQELASEVGSVREVVSRYLKKFEKNNWIKLGRGKLEILDCNGLQSFLGK